VIKLSAFADEIAADPREQVRVLQRERIGAVELRSAWGTNVLDLTDEQVLELAALFRDAGITVSSIASPIGKTAIDLPASEDEQRLTRAIHLARRFGTYRIRLFSFYGPSSGEEGWQERYRSEVLGRLRALAATAEASGVVLFHENERGIYGDTVERCRDILSSVESPAVRAAFDPANFIQAGEQPFPHGYNVLSPWIGYMHIKDALADGTVVPAGEGVTDFAQLFSRLRTDGYDGVLALEPHLASQGSTSGFSGPELFGTAVSALRSLLDEMGWSYV
jgi:sugar phosphate isomerase/epimerase